MYLSSGRYPLRIRGDTLGEPVTFGLPRREKKLTLAYRCGEREGVIAENTTREEILWTPPLELAEAFAQAVKEDINPRDSWRAARDFRMHIAVESAKRAFIESVKLAGGEL